MTAPATVSSTGAFTGQAGPPGVTAAMRETAEAFEAVLIGQLTKLMMEASQEPGEFSGGHGESMFRDIMAEQLGTQISRRGGLGLAPAVLHQIILLQNGEKR